MVRTKKETPGAVSIEDVARLSKVSISTVSRVINKSSSVKEKNRARVMEVVRQLKFQPSVVAQRLATGRSNVIALVIPRYEGIFYSFYALELLRGIGTLCEVLKFDLLLHLTDARSNPVSVKGVGGIIFADLIGNQTQLEGALAAGIPSVVINHYVEDPLVNCIGVDNVKGAEEVTEYLIGFGHKKIAHITGDVITQAAAWRLKGYKNALVRHGMPVDEELIFKTDYSRGQARQAAEKLLTSPNHATAVFVASDSMALEVMYVAREMGKEIPRDLSIVGFDDNPSGLYGPVSLTTVKQPLIRMAEESVKLLHQIISKKITGVKKILLPCELVVRESAKAL